LGKDKWGKRSKIYGAKSLHNLFSRLMVPIGENVINLIIPNEYEAK
jgi:hypothetical protein